MISAKLKKHLEKNKIKHEIIDHKKVYTALDAAATMRAKLGEIVKNLLVKADKDYFVVLLPATHNLDEKKLQKVLQKVGKRANIVKIPGEKMMQSALKLKKGAMAAFGTLHNLETVLEKDVLKNKEAFFSGGSFVQSVKMAVKDFCELEKPIMGSFGKKKKIKVVKKKVAKKAKKTAVKGKKKVGKKVKKSVKKKK